MRWWPSTPRRSSGSRPTSSSAPCAARRRSCPRSPPTCPSGSPPTRSRSSGCSRWPACSSPSPRWWPALLMVLFTASLISGSTSLPTIVDVFAHRELAIYPSLAFAGVAFTMVSLAENARIPIDNPATHLELTMIHEAMILEYSARHLALLEWASALKLFNYSCIGLALFFPFGIAEGANGLAMLAAAPALVAKLAVGGALLALIETLSAKLRIFRAPEFLGTAFLLAVLGMLVNLLLGS